MKVKICGITRLEDALVAVEAGASILGYNFYPPSPRYISPTACERIQDGLQERGVYIQTVGVFVNAAPAEIALVLDSCDLDQAQLSGDEPADHLEALGERAFKALRPASLQDALEQLRRLPARHNSPAVLVDAYKPGQFGGTGHRSDWDMASLLAAQAPIMLAGGLTPQNVAEAIRQVQPWGVDVASGVESAPGRKDAGKMLAFVRAVLRAADAEYQEVSQND